MNHGTVAVAVVQRQVMIVQAAKSHSRSDRWVDVYTYSPFGDRLFLASPVPQARILSRDILSIYPFRTTTTDMIELPENAFHDFMDLSSKYQKKYENLWSGFNGRLR